MQCPRLCGNRNDVKSVYIWDSITSFFQSKKLNELALECSNERSQSGNARSLWIQNPRQIFNVSSCVRNSITSLTSVPIFFRLLNDLRSFRLLRISEKWHNILVWFDLDKGSFLLQHAIPSPANWSPWPSSLTCWILYLTRCYCLQVMHWFRRQFQFLMFAIAQRIQKFATHFVVLPHFTFILCTFTGLIFCMLAHRNSGQCAA